MSKGNYGVMAVGSGSRDMNNNALDQLNKDALLFLHSQPIARGLRRKVAKRLKRMKVSVPA